ncbi:MULTISPECIES: hypothetical protein [unclassified Salinivibrio]|uniref:hypothetical protein n=1 Tax=unclassified Salinivibrio TaxID=2636825 RepID=UPI0009871D92|nr:MULTISPECIES: hypothetical protein [unclassified Salinivibrio]OOF10251.1 hypothetical protein BZG83_14105 [Salinivibrio sp. PR919]OOF18504.1 hypothetical protein BZG84_03410 [Salinivibrio sp. PR932]
MEDRAKSIFSSAGMYSKAAHLMNEGSRGDPSLLIPSQVNAALALELYFKSLYLIEKGSDFKVGGRHSHDFHALFSDLSRQSKEKLLYQFQSAISSRDMSDVVTMERETKVEIPRDLEGNLQSWSGVFTKVRYVYDKPKHAVSMMFFPEIEQAVRDTVINLRPDFRS